MREEFNYKPKKVVQGAIVQSLFGVAMIVFPIVYPFTIRGINLGPIWIQLFLGLIGLGLIIGGFTKMSKDKKLAAAAKPIVIDNGKLYFVKLINGQPQEVTMVLAEVIQRKHNESDGTYTLRTENLEHEFEGANFDSEREFQDFMRTIRKEVENTGS